MTNATAPHARDIADRYIALWNETEAEIRRDLVAHVWTKDAHYVDPMMQGEGHDGIDAMIAAVQQRFPAFRFTLKGEPESHNDRIRFSWMLGAHEEPPVAIGTDFGVLTPDGKFASITGFLDRVEI